MTISFNTIPSNLRTPLFFAEIDASQAGQFQQNLRALLIGQRTAIGPGANVPVPVSSVEQAQTLFGRGSILARMVELFRRNDPSTELWAVAQDDASGAVAATATITVTGTAGAAGTISLYIAGQRVQVPVGVGETADSIAARIKETITPATPASETDLPVIATASAATVTLTAKNRGALANGIDLRLNHRGSLGAEALPAGVQVATTSFGGGATNPTISLNPGSALAALVDEPFEYICIAANDGASLDAVQEFMNDQTGRWSPLKQLYGHVFTAAADDLSDLKTLGESRNDQHMTVLGVQGSPTPPWEWAAALTAQAARALSVDPARPLQTLPLHGVLAPAIPDRFTLSDRNDLLFDGISTVTYNGDIPQLERVITTYTKNSLGQPDPSYLDVTTLATLARIVREMKFRITTKFPRHKLANDGTRFGAGQAVVTPNVLRGELIALYGELESQGLVENVQAFKEHLIVERNASDPNRVDVVLPPDLVNGLIVFAAKVQFRLNFPTA